MVLKIITRLHINIKYGSGIQFDGFMYPFGDLATYADAQILFVWILQGLRTIGFNAEPYLLGIINYFPLVSFIIAGVFLVRIFEHYKVPYPFALLFSIVTIALSPQIFRVQSHFALAYAYVIPIIWWLNLRVEKSSNKSWFWVVISCCFILAHGFIHPYLIFIASIFLLSLLISNLFVSRKVSVGFIVQGLIPLICFLLIMRRLDGITDRPKNPYGLMIHKTEVSDLLPFYGWIKSVFGDVLMLRSNYSEGFAYAGILVLVVPILLIIKRAFKQKDQVQDEIVVSKSLWSYLIAGLICLACGMGLHIIITGGLILDIVPMIKQFRAMGRVSWVFYYTMFVFLAIIFYQLVDSIESKGFKWGILILVASLWGIDIYNYHKSLNEIVSTYKSEDLLNNSTLVNDMLIKKGIPANKYQAVWVLPSSSEGTEKISFRDDWSSKMNAIPFSYQTGLPLTSIVMSRSSISNSLKIMQLSSSSYVEKEVIGDFNDDRPLLIIIQNDRIDLFDDILSMSTFISKRDDFSLYEISVDSLRQVKKFTSSQLVKPTSNIESNGIYLDFEEEANNGLISRGCKVVEGNSEIFEVAIELNDSTSFGLSLWYKILDDKTDVPFFNLQSLDSNHKVLTENSFRDWDMKRVEVMNNWIRLKKSYKFSAEDKYLRLIVNGKFLHLDRVLLKQDNLDFKASTIDSSFIQLNHTIGQIEQ